jgi:mannonate dehydratase
MIMALRIAMGHVDEYSDKIGRFARQLGLRSVHLHNPVSLPGAEGFWSKDDLVRLRSRCERDGLAVEAIENVPTAHFWKIQRGVSGRDQQLENYCRTIRNAAAAGIPILGYNFLPSYVWRTDMHAPGRGGARVTAFDLDQALAEGNRLDYRNLSPDVELTEPITAEQLAANHQYFLDAVLPVAESVGMILALHPDDPPVTEPLGGVARIFTDPTSLIEVAESVRHSRSWALNLCLGTVSEMGGQAAANELIDHLAPTGQIGYVHFRDVQGTAGHFSECFLGEGNLDPARTIARLHAAGFDGFLIDDHVPAMEGDLDTWKRTDPEAYCSRGRAHAIGYLQGVLNALDLGD